MDMEMTNFFVKNVVRYISGTTYCFFWLLSIIAGFFLLICPTLLLAFVAPKIYRKWSDIVFGMWEPYPVAMMEILLNVRVTMSGDPIDPAEGAVVIMNHRTRLDWNFLWAGFFHSAHPHCHSLKFILKAPIMHIPGPGWVMQACSFLFIHRNWEKDQQLLSNSLDYLRDTKRNCQILIFPEGTDLTAKSLERSHNFADKNGLSRYFRVLHPKTTGFVFLVNTMRTNGQLQAVYDMTVGYPKVLAETELDLLRGKFPTEIHFKIQRYDVSCLPVNDPNLKDWLNTLWREKEQSLHRFYSSGSFTDFDSTPDCLEQNNTNELLKRRTLTENGVLEGCQPLSSSKHEEGIIISGNSNIPEQRGQKNGSSDLSKNKFDEPYIPGNILYLALIFWTSLVIVFCYLLFTHYYFQIWVTFYFLLFVSFSCVGESFNQILARYNKRNAKV